MRIKEWVNEERPREKMLSRGARALSNAELLAILIGSGTCGKNVMEVSQELLARSEGRLVLLSGMPMERLLGQKGLGRVRAVTIKAALELGRRAFEEMACLDKRAITSPELVYRLMLPTLKNLDHEECWALFLNRANFLIGKELISSGSLESTPLDPQKILRRGIEKQCKHIILVHNHPSGQPIPGEADIRQTERLRKALTLMGISLMDHIVVAEDAFYSFAEERVGRSR